jgi:hypothetical protein
MRNKYTILWKGEIMNVRELVNLLLDKNMDSEVRLVIEDYPLHNYSTNELIEVFTSISGGIVIQGQI